MNVVAITVCNMSNQLSQPQCMDHIDTEHTSVGPGMHASVKCEKNIKHQAQVCTTSFRIM